MSAHGACRSCGAPVVWVQAIKKTGELGAKLPLDADPERPTKALRVEGGNVVPAGGSAPDGARLVRYAKDGRYRSHFATCPNAGQHRRRPA